MKEITLTKEKTSVEGFVENKSVQKLLINITYIFLGILASNGSIFGSFAPFGAAYLASVPYQSLIWAGIGTISGVFLLSGGVAYRYIATALAVMALRWVLSEVDTLSRRKYFAPAVAFIPLLATGLVVSFATDFYMTDMIGYLTESLLSATGAYFFTRTISLSAGSRGVTSLSQQELACLAMTGCIVLLSFGRLSVADLSIGRILAVLLILICSRYGGVSGGCITGVATGIVFGISMPEYGFLSAAYAFGGLLAGLMASVGKVAVGISFLLASIIVLLQTTQTDLALTSLYEILIAGSIFMLLPKSLASRITALFSAPIEPGKTEGLRQCVTMRLDYASKALSDVSDSVNAVSEKLKTVYSPENDNVFTRAIDDVCESCGLKVYCWEKSEKVSNDDFEELALLLKQNGSVTDKDIDKKYPKRCCKNKEMANSINNNYDLCTAYSLAERQIGEVRRVVAEEFKGLGSILADLSNEFRDYEYFDLESAERVSALFKMEGLIPLDVACRVNKYNRMCVEVILADNENKELRKSELVRSVSRACGRKMDSPCISYAPDRCRLQFNEKPVYDLQIGTAQHISGGGALCGDCLNYFTDGMGRIVSIISDGMGTGGRAAVDGNMAAGILTKLIKAGLSFDCSLNIVNSALMVKSGDESLATLDVTVFDMFTGKVEFLKAGAPATFIKKGHNVLRVDAPSLPAGILREVKFAKNNINISEEDFIVMVSDGIISGGDKWLEAKLKDLGEFNVKQLADEIIRDALERRGESRDDDMTVMVLKSVQR